MLDARTLNATSLIPPSEMHDMRASMTFADVRNLGKETITKWIRSWAAEKAALEQELEKIRARHPEGRRELSVDNRWGHATTAYEGRLVRRYVHTFEPDTIEGPDATIYSDGAERLWQIDTTLSNLLCIRDSL